MMESAGPIVNAYFMVKWERAKAIMLSSLYGHRQGNHIKTIKRYLRSPLHNTLYWFYVTCSWEEKSASKKRRRRMLMGLEERFPWCGCLTLLQMG